MEKPVRESFHVILDLAFLQYFGKLLKLSFDIPFYTDTPPVLWLDAQSLSFGIPFYSSLSRKLIL
jgi:hypothetical protein